MARNGTELVKTLVERAVISSGYGQCLRGVKILSAENGKCKAELTVSKEHLNEGGTLHGGYISTLVDCISTYALMTHEVARAGVSVDLHVTFMKAALPGEVVTIDAQTMRAGRILAFLAVDLTKNAGKEMVAHGRHTKFIGSR